MRASARVRVGARVRVRVRASARVRVGVRVRGTRRGARQLVGRLRAGLREGSQSVLLRLHRAEELEVAAEKGAGLGVLVQRRPAVQQQLPLQLAK